MLNAVPVSDTIDEISEKSEGEGSEVSSHSSGESSRSGNFQYLNNIDGSHEDEERQTAVMKQIENETTPYTRLLPVNFWKKI